MRFKTPSFSASPGQAIQRRRFLRALAAGTALGTLDAALPAWALQDLPAAHTGTPPELRGPVFDLTLAETRVDFDGRTGIHHHQRQSARPDAAHARRRDRDDSRHQPLRETASIHWHGIILPFQMDGVPGMSFAGIAPGETFTYRFTLEQSGTYWYHSHSGMQEVTGVYGALIIEPRDPKPSAPTASTCAAVGLDREGPDAGFGQAQGPGRLLNYHRPTVADFLRTCARRAWRAIASARCGTRCA
jgi:FtsP/CotA-like multicopper oxidase with cupredoxin domain